MLYILHVNYSSMKLLHLDKLYAFILFAMKVAIPDTEFTGN